MANRVVFMVPENQLIREDNYPPNVEQNLQNLPFNDNNIAGAQARMQFMNAIFRQFIQEQLQNFVNIRRADPATQNAPAGLWERILLPVSLNQIFERTLQEIEDEGMNFQEVTLEQIWTKVVAYANRKLEAISQHWSPRFQILTELFNAEQHQAYLDEIAEDLFAGQGKPKKSKPKKCRKCGLYKH